jgi:hypothetical protein
MSEPSMMRYWVRWIRHLVRCGGRRSITLYLNSMEEGLVFVFN